MFEMSYKLLLADDSQINQKVVKKTLANEPFEIIDCPHADQLLNLVKSHTPDIVLLDFNLSESKTGYELCLLIKEAVPSTHVVMMYATFDNIDEDALKKNGASQKVIKPFDSYKFIALCRSLIPDEVIEEIHIPTEIKATEPEPEQPKITIAPEEKSWEVMVPGVIGEEAIEDDIFPPIIGETKPEETSTPKANASASSSNEIAFPNEDDLAYPDQDYKPKSNLVSLNTLKESEPSQNNDLNEFDFDHTEEEVKKIQLIEEQIKDEVEANLWKVDETETPAKTTPKKNFVDEYANISFSDPGSITKQEFSADMTEEMKKFLKIEIQNAVEAAVKKFMAEKVEKIAWESIPKIAEDVITKEMQKISKNISDSF
jgi:CheY-like chemotaxis protein